MQIGGFIRMVNVNQINQLSMKANNWAGRLREPNIQRNFSALQTAETTQSTGYMGKLIPIETRELIPGEKISTDITMGVQFMPFVSNLMHEITVSFMSYFVPYRLLWDKWEDFITGGKDGLNKDVIPTINILEENLNLYNGNSSDTLHTLIDYFGMPTKYSMSGKAAKVQPICFPFRAYNMIYNEHLRVPDLEEEIPEDNVKVLTGSWEWDYFSRARIFQQRGAIPTIPINDIGEKLNHSWEIGNWNNETWVKKEKNGKNGIATAARAPAENANGNWEARAVTLNQLGDGTGSEKDGTLTNYIYGITETPPDYNTNLRLMPHELEGLGVNLNDFLTGIAIMRFQVNNARIEPRYRDQLRVRFGVYPEDMRMQIPEFLNAWTLPVENGTVINTAQNQGAITGQATSKGRGGYSYEAKEHGLVMTIACIRPKPSYEGGLERKWVKNSKFDFVTPELVNLPDVAIKNYELYYKGDDGTEDEKTFGYTDIYEEYRTTTNRTTGRLRPSVNDNLKSYTLTRFFSQAPNLNADFISCKPDRDRVMMYPNEPDFIFFSRTEYRMAIPLPVQSEPAELGTLG